MARGLTRFTIAALTLGRFGKEAQPAFSALASLLGDDHVDSAAAGTTSTRCSASQRSARSGRSAPSTHTASLSATPSRPVSVANLLPSVRETSASTGSDQRWWQSSTRVDTDMYVV